ncbi:MAG: putative quinol monooxygenase [Planctomycetota bacterium]
MTQSTFAIAVTFEIHPDHVDAFRTRVIQQAQDSLRLEEGCLRFDVLVDQTNSSTIFLYEMYVDAQAFADHKLTSHFADFDQQVSPWVASKEVRRLDVLETTP